MAVLPAFEKFPREAVKVGRLLAGYADLEISLMHCVQVVRNDLDAVLKRMFRSRGNIARVNVADELGRKYYADLVLEAEFSAAVDAMKYCLCVRNLYAHCVWYDDNSGMLAFANLEDIAHEDTVVTDLSRLPIRHSDMQVLEAQIAYFEYTDTLFVWLNFEGRLRAKKIKSHALGPKPPTAKGRPPLSR